MKNITVIFMLSCLIFSACKPEEMANNENGTIDSEPVILTVLAGQSGTDPGIEEIITEAVVKKIPHLELYWEKMDWGDQFDTQVKLRFAAGEIPDIIIGKAQDIHTYAPSGNLAPMDESLLKYIRKDILSSVTYNNKIYGAPYNSFYQGVLFNKNIFEENNLSVPSTTEELEKVIETLKYSGITPFASHFEEIWYTGNIFMQLSLGEIFSNTPDWGERFRKGNVNFKDYDPFDYCFKSIELIFSNSWKDPLSVNLIECDERFANEEAAMYLTGTWSIQNIESFNPHIKIGIFPYPTSSGDTRLIVEPNLTFMKSSFSPYSELIDQVLNVILKDEELAIRLSDYTKTATLLNNVPQQYPQLISKEILSFESANRIINATVGNSQLIWSFQEEVARKTLEWIKGEISLDEVKVFADSKRLFSAIVE